MKKYLSIISEILVIVFVFCCVSSFPVLAADNYAVIVDNTTSDAEIGNAVPGNGVTNAGPKSTAYNGTDIHANTGSADSSFKWTPNLQKSGSYKVYVWYDVSDQRPAELSYEITHATGKDTKTVNQKENGGQWVELGTYSFASGTWGYVTAITKNKYTCFDAVKFELVKEEFVAAPADSVKDKENVLFSIIVDNLAANNTDGSQAKHIGSAKVNELSGKSTAYKDSITANVEPGDSSFVWIPNLTATGPYKVSVWYDTAPDSRPASVEYTVVHAEGSDKVTLNQKDNSARWVELGTYNFNTGTEGSVTAVAPAKYTCYDAVKFDFVGSADALITNQSFEMFGNIENEYDRLQLTLLSDLGILKDKYVKDFSAVGKMPVGDFKKLMETFKYTSDGSILADEEKNVTYDEVIKAFIDVLCYRPDITHKGNHILLAEEIGLVDGVAYKKDAEAYCMDIVRIAYNALDIPLLEQAYYGSPAIKFTKDYDKTLLSEVLDITKIDGRLTGFGAASIDERAHILEKNEIAVGGEVFEYEGIDDYRWLTAFGERVTAYVKIDEKSHTKTVLSLISDEEENTVYTIEAKDIVTKDEGSSLNTYSFYVNDGKKIKNIHLASQVQVIYNGRLVKVNKNSLTASAVKYLFPKSGNVKLLLDSNTNKCAWIIVTSYETLFVKKVVSTDDAVAVYDHNYNERTLKFDPSDDDCAVALYDTRYKKIAPESIPENSVISIAKSVDGACITGMVSTTAVRGTITAMETSDTGTVLSLDDSTFDTDGTYTADSYTIGQYGTFYFNAFNEITAVIEEISANGGNGFGYIIGMAKEEGMSDTIRVKMLNNEGVVRIYNFAKTVTVDNFKCKNNDVAQDRILFNIDCINKSIPTLNAGNKTRNLLQPVIYKLNSNGEVFFVDTPYLDEESRESKNTLQLMELAKNLPSANYVSSQGIFFNSSGSGVFAVNSDTKTFIVPKDDHADDSFFVSKKPSYLKNAINLNNVSAYRVSESGFEASLMVVYANDLSAYGSMIYSKDSTLAINTITKAINSDEDQVLKITGIKDGKEISLLCQADVLTEKNGEAVVPGDIIRYSLSDEGEIPEAPVERIFSIKSSNGIGAVNPASFSGDYGTTPLKAFYGYVYDIDGKYIQVTGKDPATGFDVTNSEIFNASYPDILVYEKDQRTGKGKYSIGSMADLTGFKTDDFYYSKVLLLSVEKIAQSLIIFKN